PASRETDAAGSPGGVVCRLAVCTFSVSSLPPIPPMALPSGVTLPPAPRFLHVAAGLAGIRPQAPDGQHGEADEQGDHDNRFQQCRLSSSNNPRGRRLTRAHALIVASTGNGVYPRRPLSFRLPA